MHNFHQLIQKQLQQKGLSEKAAASEHVFKAQQWLLSRLPQFAAEIQCVKIQDGVLFCEVTHSIAAQELQSVSHELVEFIQSESSETIDSLRILRK